MGAACAIGVRSRIRIWLYILQKLARVLQKLARPTPVKLIQLLDPLALAISGFDDPSAAPRLHRGIEFASLEIPVAPLRHRRVIH
jgi:hypothetical protein